MSGRDAELDAVLAALRPLEGKGALGFLDVERRSFRSAELRQAAGAWSSGERMLVDVAVALWEGAGLVDLGALVCTLDGPHWHAVLDAIAVRRGRDLHGYTRPRGLRSQTDDLREPDSAG